MTRWSPTSSTKLLIVGLGAAILIAVVWGRGRAARTSETPVPVDVLVHDAASPLRASKEEARSGTTTRPRDGSRSFSKDTLTKLDVLSEVLASRNDNDPRLDRDFKDLSDEAKGALEEKYRAMAPEDRNGRGTIVFLVGRELKSSQDFSFLKEVMNEAPCLSLADCSKEDHVGIGADAHLEGANGVTLAYPSLVAIYSVQKYLASGAAPPGSESREQAMRILQAGAESPMANVSRKAREIISAYP